MGNHLCKSKLKPKTITRLSEKYTLIEGLLTVPFSTYVRENALGSVILNAIIVILWMVLIISILVALWFILKKEAAEERKRIRHRKLIMLQSSSKSAALSVVSKFKP